MKHERTYEFEGQFWADKVMDLANLEVVAVSITQLVAPHVAWETFVAGVIMYVGFSLIARGFLRKKVMRA